MKNLFFLICSLLLSLHGVHPEGVPEHPDCKWNTNNGEAHIQRMRDRSDCRYFYHCAGRYSEPLRDMCPQQENYTLYFNPETSSCDYEEFAPEWCFADPTTSAPTTTEEPTTTTEPTTTPTPPATAPPILDDKFDFNVNCENNCGIFANPDDCSNFIFCENGQKVIKNCNEGQLFDVKTEECQPAEDAQCWEEPNLGPHQWERGHECPFHGYQPTKPISEDETSLILQNPVVTNWGNWQPWVECPKGMFSTGIYAWREMVEPGWTVGDHAGITQLSLTCQTPGGNETDYIESVDTGSIPYGWPHYYWCTGAMVGFQLNSVKANTHRNPLGNVDEIATDNVRGYCSCSEPVMKPYDELVYAPQHTHRGDWTETQFCKKYQAVCGMQTQMHHFKYKEGWQTGDDNKGLNNLKMKCCDVANPVEVCNVEEKRYFVRDCDNSENGVGGKCDFDSMVGLIPDYDMEMKRMTFYSSVGYEFDYIKDDMRKKIGEGLEAKVANGESLEYNWDQRTEEVESDEVITKKSLFVEPRQNVELYQIVGKCGHILMQSNRYVRITKDASGAVISENYFDV